MSNAASFIKTAIPQQAFAPDIGSKVSNDFMTAFTASRDMKRQNELDQLEKRRKLQLMDLDEQMMPLKIRAENLGLKKMGLDVRDAEFEFSKKEQEQVRDDIFDKNGGASDPGNFTGTGGDNTYRANNPFTKAQKKNSEGIKLSNFGYDSDSSPDHNSNVLKIGHANNKLEDGVSAALTKSLATRHGLKTGDMFEARLSDGTTITRRYDDTVPTTYKGRPLPETVDLYNRKGSNSFGGRVVGIKPLGREKRSGSDLTLPEGPLDGLDDGMVLPPRGAI
jgi:hypothetical protein